MLQLSLPLPQQRHVPAAGGAGGVADEGEVDGGVRQGLLVRVLLHLPGRQSQGAVQAGAEVAVAPGNGAPALELLI